MRLLVDSTVLAYASGGEHPQREACRAILRAGATGDVRLHASVEAIQEFTFHRMRRGDRAVAVDQAHAFMAGLTLHAFDTKILARSIELIGESTVRGRDAVHAATALELGLTEIVSADTDFDGIPGLTRVDPADVQLNQS